MKAAVLAFGTRGDVQPLAIIAEAWLQNDHRVSSVVFVTHAAHAPLLSELLHGVETFFVDTPPVLAGGASAFRGAAPIQERACIAACAGASVLLFNLFALEGWHIAEARGIPCAVLHPYLIPTPTPTAFRHLLRAANPAAFRRLYHGSGNPDALGLDDVEHWLWPAYTDRWAPLRRALGLGDVPLEGRGHSVSLPPLPRPPPALYAFSGLLVDRPAFWPAAVEICGAIYPPDEDRDRSCGGSGGGGGGGSAHDSGSGRHGSDTVRPVLMEFLAAGPRPLYVGFGSMVGAATHVDLTFVLRVVLAAARQAGLRAVVSAAPEAAAVVVAASSGQTRPTGDAESIRGGGEGDQGGDATNGGGGGDAGSDDSRRAADVLWLHDSVPHGWLFPQCIAAVHHGGSGTTAAALRAGIPQVICPMAFDQFFWAERVEYLGYGVALERSLWPGRKDDIANKSLKSAPPPMPPPPSVVARVADAIAAALTPQQRLRCACAGKREREEEDGLRVVLQHLMALTEAAAARGSGDTSLNGHEVKCNGGGVEEDGTGHNAGCEDDNSEADERSLPAAAPNSNSGIEAGGVDVLQCMEMPNGLSLWYLGMEEAAFIYREIFEQRCYAQCGVAIPETAGALVVDVGANIGLFSIFAELERDEPGTLRVLAFEPAPAARRALRRNLRPHLPAARISGYALGAAADDAATLTFYPRMPGNSTRRPGEKAAQRGLMNPRIVDELFRSRAVPCRVRTLSWALRRYGVADNVEVSLLKIDVEGDELDVLRGVEERDWPRIRQVAMEVHDIHGRVAAVRTLLAGRGFLVTVHCAPHGGGRGGYGGGGGGGRGGGRGGNGSGCSGNASDGSGSGGGGSDSSGHPYVVYAVRRRGAF